MYVKIQTYAFSSLVLILFPLAPHHLFHLCLSKGS